MSDFTRLCAVCGVSIEGSHFNSTMCSAVCRRADKTRRSREQRHATYVKHDCGWCGASLAGKSQQARFCSASCMDKQRYKDNRESRKAAVLAYSKTPAGRHVDHERRRRKRARLREATIIPFSAEQLAARLAMFPGCWMCGGDWDTLDHVKPLAKGGAHTLSNIRPACRSCNSSKNDTWEGVRHAMERASTPRRLSIAGVADSRLD